MMIRTRTLALFVAFVLGACLLVSTAHAGTGYGTVCYRADAHTQVDTLCVRRTCIRAEDSARVLVLVNYGHKHAAYTCKHKGY